MADDTGSVAERAQLERELQGMDALDVPFTERERWATTLWNATWPKLLAIGAVLFLWQLVAWTGWRPGYVLPPPARVLGELAELLGTSRFWVAAGTTLRRALAGYALALAIGSAVGLLVWRSALARRALGALVAGLQSMPSIAWFPFAILLFGLSESAILFVIVLGAAPSIANGLLSGIDQIPVLLLRAGRVLGARGVARLQHIVLPAALPGYLAGLKQGWAFAWRSLMAGELLVVIETRPALGSQLQFARELSDAPRLVALMLVILLIGILVEGLAFGTVERGVRRRRGLLESGAA